jgi:hypothetical protein
MHLRLSLRRAALAAAVFVVGCGGDDGAASPTPAPEAGADAPGPPNAAPDAGTDAEGAAPPTPTFRVGGTTSGLSRLGLVLHNAGSDPLAVTANGPFVFATALADGADYSVTVATQPEAQSCTVANAAGKISSASITDVAVVCIDKTKQLGGERQGLALSLAGSVTTLAGTAVTKDAIGASASFLDPDALVEHGGSLYIADAANRLVRKVVLSTGTVTTVAGHPSSATSIDGVGAAAGFSGPGGIATDGANLYVSDASSCTIRKIVIATAAVSTIAGGSCGTPLDGNGSAARFFVPRGVTLEGTNLYVAESFAVRKVDLASGDVTTIAGGTSVTDRHGQTIRKIEIASGTVTTVAGIAGQRGSADGVGTAATFELPHGLATDGSALYITAAGSHTVRKMVLATGVVSTIAGSGGLAGSTDALGGNARFDRPEGLALSGGSLYVSDNGNRTIRKVALGTASVTTIAGTPAGTDGIGPAGRFGEPAQIATDGSNAFVADPVTGTIRKIVVATGAVSTVAGTPGTGGWVDAAGASARFRDPHGVTIDGAHLYVADSHNQRIRKIVVATGAVTTLAGDGGMGSTDGTASVARFNEPRAITNDGTHLYVADTWNHRIRKIEIATGVVTTIAGSTAGTTDGVGTDAKFLFPEGIATDGTNLYVADTSANKIRKVVIATGAVTTLAGADDGSSGSVDGTGTSARFRQPRGIGTDGTNVYVADSENHTIRRVVVATGEVTTLAGMPATNAVVDGQGNAARFFYPGGIATDGVRLLVMDSLGATLRRVE